MSQHAVINTVIALALGMLFGTGLAVSEMTNPALILADLDIFGAWNPALIFVMGGALLVTVPGFQLMRLRGQPFFAREYFLPQKLQIDTRLITGAVLFGLGWGLVGLCPGPAITALATLDTNLLLFVVSMLAGMLVFRFIPD